MERKNEYSERFIEVIDRLGLSNKEILDSGVMSKSLLSMIKNGKQGVSLDSISLFCKKFEKVSADYILTGKGYPLKDMALLNVDNDYNSDVEKSYLEKETFYLKLIGEKTDDLIKAKDTIAQLRAEIEDLKRQVESAGRDSNKTSIGAVKHRMG